MNDGNCFFPVCFKRRKAFSQMYTSAVIDRLHAGPVYVWYTNENAKALTHLRSQNLTDGKVWNMERDTFVHHKNNPRLTIPNDTFRYSDLYLLPYEIRKRYCSGKLFYVQIGFVKSTSEPFSLFVPGAGAFTVRQSPFQGETFHMLIKGTSTLQSHNGTLHSTSLLFKRFDGCMQLNSSFCRNFKSPHFLSYTVPKCRSQTI